MRKLVVGNWKMNPKSWKEAKRLFNAFKKLKAVVCPPFVYFYLFPLFSSLELGAQDCHYEQSGAYTGEISPKMLKSLGVKYVIIGHSERRNYFNETDEIINKKLKAVLKQRLIPILCVGEKKGEDAEKVVNNQLREALKGISGGDSKKIIIAYEPVWAISTSGGGYCSSERANEIRRIIRTKFNNKIIYGGSVDSKDAKGYLDVGFDGVLVGSASLDSKDFKKIVEKCF